MVCVHNHKLDCKLTCHSIIIIINVKEKKYIVEMTMTMAFPKHILMTLKIYRLDSVTHVKQVYNTRHINNKDIKGFKN